MVEEEFTWVAIADGERARVFEERARLGPLHERTDLADKQSREDRRHSGHMKATVHDRVGYGQHNADEYSPRNEAERKFLHRFAQRLNKARAEDAFAHLILVAPPKALGFLKDQLDEQTAKRVVATDPHERVNEDAKALGEHIRALPR